MLTSSVQKSRIMRGDFGHFKPKGGQKSGHLSVPGTTQARTQPCLGATMA
jgi:hypothetical protein